MISGSTRSVEFTQKITIFARQKSPAATSAATGGAYQHDPLHVHAFITSRKNSVHLVHDNYVFRSNMKRYGPELRTIYWECVHNRERKCRARLKSIGDELFITCGKNAAAFSAMDVHVCVSLCSVFAGEHNHDDDAMRVQAAAKANALAFKTMGMLTTYPPLGRWNDRMRE